MTTKKHPATIPAAELPVYGRAVKRFPHLAHVKDSQHFCAALCRLAAVEGISAREYNQIAKTANGEPWPAECGRE